MQPYLKPPMGAASARPLRRLTLIALLLLGALLLAACASPVPDAPAPPAPASTPTPEPAPTDTPAPPTAAAEPEEEEPLPVSTTFVIVPEESEARFSIDELLFGEPKTVVGATSALTGELTVDPVNPSASQVGAIQIEAGDFVTDNDRRNMAIRRFILQTGQYRFITFNATALVGLPDSVTVGDEIQFEIAGDLTVRDITQPVRFAVTMQVVSETELRGSAATVVARESFKLTIPQVPSVANVGEEFIVEFDFVARAQ